jgi:hypothetical protein
LKPYPLIHVAPGEGHDVSAIWEMSRLQGVPTLLAAARRSPDDRWGAAWTGLVDSWIEANPPGYGPNWMTGMDVGMRGINLALGLAFFDPGPRRDAIAGVIWSHVRYIVLNDIRRQHRPRNNHYLVSLVGLLVMSGLFAGSEAQRLGRIAFEALVGEILFQFLPDGGSFEASTHYHLVSLEAALTAFLFLQAIESPQARAWPPEAVDRLRRALDLVADGLTAFGASPQMGDSTFTRILFYRDYFSWRPLDPTFLFDLADLALPGGYRRPDGLRRACYDDSGYGFFSGERYGIVLNSNACGSSSDPGQGHHHCDKGSLVMQVGGAPLFVDNGTYCYTSDPQARFEFKGTGAHNVIRLDGREQLDARADVLFGVGRSAAAAVRHEPDDGIPTFTAWHDGYARFPDLGRVTRRVRCHPDRLAVEERVEGAGRHDLEIRWHLHPDIRVMEAEGVCLLQTPGGAVVRVESPSALSSTVEPSSYSEAYGERRPSRMLRFAGRVELPWSVRYAFLVGPVPAR